jgi:hypothetical protein
MVHHPDFTDFCNAKSNDLSYCSWDSFIYVDGGFMLVKKHIIINIKLNPYLNWGEMEDVDLSQRLYLYGSLINFYEGSTLFTQTHRHRRLPQKKRRKFVPNFISDYRTKNYVKKRDSLFLNDFYNFLKKN